MTVAQSLEHSLLHVATKISRSGTDREIDLERQELRGADLEIVAGLAIAREVIGNLPAKRLAQYQDPLVLAIRSLVLLGWMPTKTVYQLPVQRKLATELCT